MALGQEQIGQRIKAAREDAGLTQPDLAARIGLKHPQSISRYERGLTDIPPAKLRRIAEATGKPMTFFVEEEEQAPRISPDQAALLAERVEAMQADLNEMKAAVLLLLERLQREDDGRGRARARQR